MLEPTLTPDQFDQALDICLRMFSSAPSIWFCLILFFMGFVFKYYMGRLRSATSRGEKAYSIFMLILVIFALGFVYNNESILF